MKKVVINSLLWLSSISMAQDRIEQTIQLSSPETLRKQLVKNHVLNDFREHTSLIRNIGGKQLSVHEVAMYLELAEHEYFHNPSDSAQVIREKQSALARVKSELLTILFEDPAARRNFEEFENRMKNITKRFDKNS
jgi:hypothetical protein